MTACRLALVVAIVVLIIAYHVSYPFTLEFRRLPDTPARLLVGSAFELLDAVETPGYNVTVVLRDELANAEITKIFAVNVCVCVCVCVCV
jgi:hypothetical protein